MKFCFLILISSLWCYASSAHAEFHRFYRGYVLPDLKDFITVVNKDFFPLFPRAASEGLTSYKPILINEEKNLNLPQEIVLITFKDEPSYKTYGESEIGKKIRAAHGPVFDSTKSKSLVPTLFNGAASVETAYVMNPDFHEFSKGASGVLIQADPFGAPASTLSEINKILSSTGKQNIISLIAESYVIEYLFATDEAELDKMRSQRCSQFKGAFKKNKFVTLKKHKVGDGIVNFGEGMDAQW